MPTVGYGAPKKLKYLHPSGLKDILIHNLKDLENINVEKEAVRIASAIGKKKRSEILKKSEEMKLRVLNP